MPVPYDDVQINTRYVEMLTLNVLNTTIVMLFYHFDLLVESCGLKVGDLIASGATGPTGLL